MDEDEELPTTAYALDNTLGSRRESQPLDGGGSVEGQEDAGPVGKSESVAVHEQIARVVAELFKKLPDHGKPKEAEHTVLAAFVFHDNVKDRFDVISLGTGTKCLGSAAEDSDSQGCLLVDSHAEVIARRGLQRYLLKCCALLARYQSNDGELPVQVSSKVPLRFRLKDTVSIHLFISDSPCGDSSIYNTTLEESSANFTGAKIVPTDLLPVGDWHREDTQQIGCMRTKSGRSDICAHNRTMSKSCSDKICRWLYTGLQG
jgi:tRNA-specific adenosine deaminase 1